MRGQRIKRGHLLMLVLVLLSGLLSAGPAFAGLCNSNGTGAAHCVSSCLAGATLTVSATAGGGVNVEARAVCSTQIAECAGPASCGPVNSPGSTATAGELVCTAVTVPPSAVTVTISCSSTGGGGGGSVPNGAFALVGSVHLPQFPCQGPGLLLNTCSGATFSGTATGAAVTLPGIGILNCSGGCPVSAGPFDYLEPSTCPAPPPVGWVLNGSGTIAGYPFTFVWGRLGAVAGIGLVSGNGIGVGYGWAAFEPLPPLGTYNPGGGCPQDITATVAGVIVTAGT